MATSVCDLPRDLLAHVITFLYTHERLLKTDMVSKAFREAGAHPMCTCWDNCIVIKGDLAVQSVVNLLLSRHYKANLFIDTHGLTRGSFTTLSRLTDLRQLCLYQNNIASCTLTEMLSSLHQLEQFSVFLPKQGDASISAGIELPYMHVPHLNKLNLLFMHLESGSGPDTMTIVNLDSTHLPILSEFMIACRNLHASSFPLSLTHLVFNTQRCSTQVKENVAKLPNLRRFVSHFTDIISQPHLLFTSSLTDLSISHILNDMARENLAQMTRLSELHISYTEPTVADMEVIASLPSLTSLEVASRFQASDDGWASFRHAPSLQTLSADCLGTRSIQSIVHSSLTSLTLDNSYDVASFAPLAVCVNLIHLNIDARISLKDALVISGLSLIEYLSVYVESGYCIIPICQLPRLKVLRVGRGVTTIYEQVLSHLPYLAPTLEVLRLYDVNGMDTEAAVRVFSKLRKLRVLVVEFEFTREQILLLRSSLPRLCTLSLSPHFDLHALVD